MPVPVVMLCVSVASVILDDVLPPTIVNSVTSPLPSTVSTVISVPSFSVIMSATTYAVPPTPSPPTNVPSPVSPLKLICDCPGIVQYSSSGVPSSESTLGSSVELSQPMLSCGVVSNGTVAPVSKIRFVTLAPLPLPPSRSTGSTVGVC